MKFIKHKKMITNLLRKHFKFQLHVARSERKLQNRLAKQRFCLGEMTSLRDLGRLNQPWSVRDRKCGKLCPMV